MYRGCSCVVVVSRNCRGRSVPALSLSVRVLAAIGLESLNDRFLTALLPTLEIENLTVALNKQSAPHRRKSKPSMATFSGYSAPQYYNAPQLSYAQPVSYAAPTAATTYAAAPMTTYAAPPVTTYAAPAPAAQQTYPGPNGKGWDIEEQAPGTEISAEICQKIGVPVGSKWGPAPPNQYQHAPAPAPTVAPATSLASYPAQYTAQYPNYATHL